MLCVGGVHWAWSLSWLLSASCAYVHRVQQGQAGAPASHLGLPLVLPLRVTVTTGSVLAVALEALPDGAGSCWWVGPEGLGLLPAPSGPNCTHSGGPCHSSPAAGHFLGFMLWHTWPRVPLCVFPALAACPRKDCRQGLEIMVGLVHSSPRHTAVLQAQPWCRTGKGRMGGLISA